MGKVKVVQPKNIDFELKIDEELCVTLGVVSRRLKNGGAKIPFEDMKIVLRNTATYRGGEDGGIYTRKARFTFAGRTVVLQALKYGMVKLFMRYSGYSGSERGEEVGPALVQLYAHNGVYEEDNATGFGIAVRVPHSHVGTVIGQFYNV